MPECCPLSLYGVVAIRASKLNDDCTYQTGDCSSYANSGVIEITFEENISEGTEIERKDADGNLCVYNKECDILKNYDVSGSFCSLSAEAAAVLFGSNTLEDAEGEVIGFGQPSGKICHPPLALELFVHNGGATGKCAPAECSPLARFFFPCVRLRMTSFTFNEDVFEWQFSGTAEANPRALDGPFSDLEIDGDIPPDNIVNGWAIDALPDTLVLDTCCQPVPDDANQGGIKDPIIVPVTEPATGGGGTATLVRPATGG